MINFTPEEIAWFWLLAAPSLAALGMVLFNLVVWPRGRESGKMEGRVSVCIPARNEGRRIVRCVAAVLAGEQRPHEILVYDDASTDGTADVLHRLCAAEPSLRVIRGDGELPVGWLGKPHACDHLAREARGDVLVFVDADTVVTPTCLNRLGWIMEHKRADFVTALPEQATGVLTEQMVVPLLNLSYLCWLPMPLVWLTRFPWLRVANGQLVAVKREALEKAGGWASVAGEVAADVKLCGRIKAAGSRAVYADGSQMAHGRMFHNRTQLWRGLSRMLYHRGPGALGIALSLVLYGGVLLAPYIGLVQAIRGYGDLLWPSVIGIVANHLIRVAIAVRLRQSSNGIVLHPLGLLWMIALLLNSLRRGRRGTLFWSGRRYVFGEGLDGA
ncbi:MAG TPA: glycosyltransferase family 2 protein [Longimicrobium sp.]|jgi:cellulose synthase/poly-beta-1,6-N-acetylglucosamine synthase-like glycosyltransferase